MRKPERLAVLAPNWLGDAVMALPLVADIRRAWPDTRIIVAARKAVAPLYSMVPAIDDALTLDGERDVERLADARCDAVVLLPNSFASAWLARRAQIPQRWGYARDLRRPLLTAAIPPPRRYAHQVEYYQSIGTALGIPAGPPYAAIQVSAEARKGASALLDSHGITEDTPFVVFAPGAAYGRAKQWLPSRFADLARLLSADGIKTALVGAKGDLASCAEVARAAEVTNLAGKTDLTTLAAVLSRSRAAVTNDSGAMHLAAAVGVPLTAIFGPTNDEKTAPLRATDTAPSPVIIATDVWCRPCMLRECPIDHRCMTRITAPRVHESVRVALS
jgi:heptosyltransferase II